MIDYMFFRVRKNTVTVHSVLCIYCTVREKVIQECINPIAVGDFNGFMQVTGHGVNSNQLPENGNICLHFGAFFTCILCYT